MLFTGIPKPIEKLVLEMTHSVAFFTFCHRIVCLQIVQILPRYFTIICRLSALGLLKYNNSVVGNGCKKQKRMGRRQGVRIGHFANFWPPPNYASFLDSNVVKKEVLGALRRREMEIKCAKAKRVCSTRRNYLVRLLLPCCLSL